MNTTKVYANMLAVTCAKRLNGERLRRIVEAKTVGDAFKMLADYGYAYTDGCSTDGFIVGETDCLIDFVRENAASEKLASALIARFDYNNAKLAYKSRFVSVPSDGYYHTGIDCKKIAEGDYSDVDACMAKALETLDESGENRPQEIDLCLTRAMYDDILLCGLPSVVSYFRAEIDMKNILTAARMKRLKLIGDEFLSGGHVGIDKLVDAAHGEGFAEFFENTEFFEFAENIENNDFAELWKAERDADDYLYFMTDSDVASFSSNKPFINYYTETLIELKTVKTALVCIKTDSRDSFYKRIPAIYKS